MPQQIRMSELRAGLASGKIGQTEINQLKAAGYQVLNDEGPQATTSGPRPQAAAGHGATGEWQPPPPNYTLGGMAANVLPSAGRLASDIGTAVMHPIETAKTVGQTAVGAVQKGAVALGAAPPEERGLTDYRPKADAVGQMFADRYGSYEKAKKTAYEDPIGALLDASALVSAGGSAVAKTGTMTGVRALETAGKTLGAAGEAIDPIRMATKGTAAVAGRVAEKVGAPILGATTGTGKAAVEVAADATAHPKFSDALRGNITDEEVVSSVKGAAQKLADNRAADYQQQLAQLPQNIQVTTKPVVAEMRSQLSKFGVKFDPAALTKGQYKLDFSGSLNKITDTAEQGALQEAVDDLVKNASAGASTPLEMDALKQRMAQRVGAGGRADKILTSVKNTVRDTLNKTVPGYQDMTAEYAKASDFLDKITTEFSLKGKAGSEGTIVRKLSTALNQRNEFREVLIDALDGELGTDIKGMIAGRDMSSIAPRGLMKTVAGGGAVVGAFLHNPAAIAGLAASSPRFVGEALMALAKARKGAGALPSVRPSVIAAPTRAIVNAQGEGDVNP